MLAWLRKRMNKLLWAVAIIVAVSFGVTYTMMTVLERMLARHNYVYIFGEKVKDYELAYERGMLQTENILTGKSSHVDQKDVLEQLAMLKEAERLGLRVSEATVQQWVLGWYKKHKLIEMWWMSTANRTQEEFRKKEEEFYNLPPAERTKILNEIEEKFTEGDFKRLLENQYHNITPSDFREAMRRLLLKGMLLDVVDRNADVSVNEVYEEFIRRFHKRKFQMVYLRASDFRDTVLLDEDKLKEFYEEVKESYKHPERLSFDYVMLSPDELQKDVPEPTRDDLKKLYDRQKWQPPIWQPTGEPKPFEEVTEFLTKKFKETQSLEMAHQKMEEMLKEIDKKSEEEINKILVEKNLVLKRTKPSADEEFSELNSEEFGKTPVSASQMYREVRQKGPDKLKGVFSGPLKCEKGVFIWRLAEVIPPKVKEFDEVRKEIEDRYRIKEAVRIAEEAAKGIALEVRAGSNMREIAFKRNLVLIETDFVSNAQYGGKIPGVVNQAALLKAGFNEEGDNPLKQVGDVAGPISVPMGGDTYFYIIRYAGRQDPDVTKFFGDYQYYYLHEEMKRKRKQEVEKKWKDDLLARASIVDEDGNSVLKKLNEPPKVPPEGEIPTPKE